MPHFTAADYEQSTPIWEPSDVVRLDFTNGIQRAVKKGTYTEQTVSSEIKYADGRLQAKQIEMFSFIDADSGNRVVGKTESIVSMDLDEGDSAN